MKIYADPLLAETVPDGTFGGARRLRSDGPEQPRRDRDAARRRARLAAEVARIDNARNYGRNRRYQTTDPKGTP